MSLLTLYISVEWESDDGQFIALGCKMYQCKGQSDEKPKKSTKGVPHKEVFDQETFEGVLFNRLGRQTCTINSLRKDRDKRMTRTSVEKTSLSDIFVKMMVQSDAVTCKPLMKNGKHI